MSDEITTTEETTENPILQDVGVNMDSSPSDTTSEAPQDATALSTPEVVNNTAPINTENKAEIPENTLETGNSLENPASNQTIQGNLETNASDSSEPQKISETLTSAKATDGQANSTDNRTGQTPVSDPLPVSTSSKPSQRDLWKRFLDKVQIGKRKKLEKIMTLFLKQSKITNDEVEKFLRVSDKTAERYLDILEKENRIKQVGKTGHAVFYSKI